MDRAGDTTRASTASVTIMDDHRKWHKSKQEYRKIKQMWHVTSCNVLVFREARIDCLGGAVFMMMLLVSRVRSFFYSDFCELSQPGVLGSRKEDFMIRSQQVDRVRQRLG
jgi:UDP-N-acetylmuramoylalanine-D-glutamate ligase